VMKVEIGLPRSTSVDTGNAHKILNSKPNEMTPMERQKRRAESLNEVDSTSSGSVPVVGILESEIKNRVP